MFTDYLPTGAIILVSVISVILIFIQDWRIHIVMLYFLYVGVFFLVSEFWTTQMAAVKLIAGFIAATVLSLTIYRSNSIKERLNPGNLSFNSYGAKETGNYFLRTGRPFYIITSGLAAVAVFYLTPNLSVWFPELTYLAALGGLILIGMGLSKLGFSYQPFTTTIGLLMFLAGFEIIYANLENSTLVAGLLAIITVGIASAGAYLLILWSTEVAN